MAKIPLSQVEDNFRLLPEGMYDGAVTDCELIVKNIEPREAQWKVTIELNPPDGKGTVTVVRYLTWYGKALKFAWQDAQNILGEPIDLTDNSFDDEEDRYRLIGRPVKVVLEHNLYNGETRNSVGKILKPTADGTGSAPAKKGKTALNF